MFTYPPLKLEPLRNWEYGTWDRNRDVVQLHQANMRAATPASSNTDLRNICLHFAYPPAPALEPQPLALNFIQSQGQVVCQLQTLEALQMVHGSR